MSYKIDLHTHSYESLDGGLSTKDYTMSLAQNKLQYIAITDHNTIKYAQKLNQKFGSQIIIGEEITTTEGEIIGLYITKKINPGLSLVQTAQEIVKQGGLVYIPHPFETLRKGVSKKDLDSILQYINIIETYNGRAYFNNKSANAIKYATSNKIAMAASSDAHGPAGWCKTYSVIKNKPTKENLVEQLQSAQLSGKKVGVGILYPKINKFKKAIIGHNNA